MIAIERRNFRRRPRWLRGLPSDPRIFQITVLGMLLGAGAWLRDFALRPEQCVLTFAAAFATQWLGDRWRGADGGGARSAAITALSLSLLLRADGLWAHPLAAIVAVGAKFVVRVRGKHLFNPGNLGVIVALVAFPGTWVSAGQWGADFVAAGWFVALGGLVVHRARRADVTVAFLGFHAAVLAFRVAWLGQSAGVWLHQLAKWGALAVRLLHDLRSQDDPGSQVRARGTCRVGLRARLPLAVHALPAELAAVGLVPGGARGPAVGRALAGEEIPMANPRRHG